MKRVFGTPITDYMPALGLLIITAIYLATAYNYSPDARAVPAGVAWVMLALVLLDLISRTQTGIGTRMPGPVERSFPVSPSMRKTTIESLSWLAAKSHRPAGSMPKLRGALPWVEAWPTGVSFPVS